MRRRAVVFLMSDFIIPEYDSEEESIEELFLKELSTSRRKHDLVCCQIHDSKERKLPAVGRVLFEDAESGETITINTSEEKFRKQYQAYTQEVQESFVRKLKRRGIDNFEFSTTSDYAKTLKEFFHTRVNRRGR